MVRWVKIQPDLAGRFAGEMDHAQSAGNQIPLANRFVDRNGGELRHLIRARDKASGAARPKQLGVPNVVTNSLKEATDKGLPAVAYGAFINTVIDFLIIAFVLFLIISQFNRLKKPAPAT